MNKVYCGKSNFWIFVVFFICLSTSIYSNQPPTNIYKFIENKGQWDNAIFFKATIPNGNIFLEKNCLTYNLYDGGVLKNMHDGKIKCEADLNFKFHSLKVNFLNSNDDLKITGEKSIDEYFNFYIGNEPEKWSSGVKGYEKVNYDELYKGINLDLYTRDNKLKYDFVISANADVRQIKLKYTGAKSIFLKDGDLHVTTSVGTIIEKKPYAYQFINGKLLIVQCDFLLKDSVVSFNFPKGYNTKHNLVIDPELIFSTYSGSLADNFGYSATFDSEGFLYAAGSIFNLGYVTTPGAYQQKFMGGDTVRYNRQPIFTGTDVAITKYDTSGTLRIYSTYLGGSGTELPHSLVIDKDDQLLLYGTTSSADFPLKNPIQNKFLGGNPVMFTGLAASFNSGSDLFITRFDFKGENILNSTYLGGKKNDGLNTIAIKLAFDNDISPLTYNYADEIRGEIDLDAENNIILSTCTNSTDFPMIGNSFQPIMGGGELDAIVVKLNPTMDRIIWSSYLGGGLLDAAYSIDIDSNNDIYIVGGTSSTNFPTTAKVLKNNHLEQTADGFITHVSKDGSKILESTYYGYENYDQNFFVELDKDNNVYVFGQTERPGSKFITNAKYSKVNGGQYVSKISPSLNNIIWSTSFGTSDGFPNISPTAFLVDLCNKVYLSGWGGLTNIENSNGTIRNSGVISRRNNAGYVAGLDITNDAFQKTTDSSDFYLMVLADDASEIIYGSYFGGTLSHEHVDGGTSRFDRKGKIYQSVCAGCSRNNDFPIFPSNAVSPTNNSRNCNNGVFKFDFKLPIVLADFKFNGCNPISFQNKSLIQKQTTYQWDFGDGTLSTEKNPSHTYLKAGKFNVKLKLFDNFTCNLSDSMSKEIYISPVSIELAATANPSTIYKNYSSQLQAFPIEGFMYTWTLAASLNNNKIPNPIASPKDTTTYNVNITDPINNCNYDASVKVNVIDVYCGEPNIYIPNAFTPNNDGENDELFVRGEVLQELNLIIYDRWGEKIFETNDQKKGWNGYFKGMKIDPGVFVYYLEATCVNKEKFVKKGNITLIR